ncbi:uncharacterized protein V6R79_023067 [Siganus canaliculatus]
MAENMSLHPLGTAAAPVSELVCIFGTGDFGRSLGLCLLRSGYRVVYGSRRPGSCGPLPEGSQVMSYEKAAQLSNLIFICVHREHYGFLESLADHLQGKVLVDISNNLKKGMYPEANAAYLQSLIPRAAVVKGLNTLSAWALQNGILAQKQVYLCGNSAGAKQTVAELATKMGLTVQDKGSLSAARELEDFPLRLFPEWRLTLAVTVGLMAFFFIYLVIRDVIHGYVVLDKKNAYIIMVSLANKVFAIVSLIMLALCYLPGGIAAFLQLYRGTKYSRFPNWLDRWMLCRKEIGLAALALAFLHAIYSIIKPMRPATQNSIISTALDEMRKNSSAALLNYELEWRVDSNLSLGILGFFLFCLIGLTSLPSVGGNLSWREFSFVQSKLGYICLLICTLHAYIYGWNSFLKRSSYKWYTPPDYMLCLIVPTVVLVLKAIVLLPCVDRTLTRIRQGWDRKPRRDEMDLNKATNF